MLVVYSTLCGPIFFDGTNSGQRPKDFGGNRRSSDVIDRSIDRSTLPKKMSSVHSHRMIANLDDDSPRDELALFDDDDPFNLPPPLPPLSPQREDDGTNQDGDVAAQGDQEAGEGDQKETNKKRKVKRSPRPKLDEVRLCGNRGIPALSHLCDDIKFKGKGHETSDLKLLIQRYEHWAHRLFPKFPFADVVDQVENLGSKKLVQNCIKRIRRGEDDEVEDRSDTELAQNGESQDDGGLSQVPLTPGITNNQAFGVQMEAADRVVILTPEQQERIRLNRERALAKRKAAQERQAQQNNTQTDDQTNPAEESTQSTDDVEVPKENEDTTENAAEVENDSSLPANDIEMEDDIVDKNVRSGEDDEQESLEKGSDTNVENVESTSMATDKENVDQEDIEMATAETAPLNSVDIVQEESNVPEEGNTNTNKTTEDNDLLGSARDLASNKADADLAAASLMEETSSSSRNDEELDQEGPQETLDARSTEQAPDENEPVEPQNAEMETEQT